MAIALMALGGAIAVVIQVVPSNVLTVLGKRAALLSVGMRHPGSGAELVSGRATAPSAAAPGGALSEHPLVLSEVVTQVVQSTTVTGTIPDKKAGAGQVLTQLMSPGKEFVQDVAIKNNTGKTVDIAAALAHTPALGFSKTSHTVQVLITHTHTTECYLGYDAGFYNTDDPTRTEDSSRNMIAVGERVADKLRQAGIGVVHDTTIHDQPYSSAYTHSRKAVEQYLKRYPDICVVLDIHRDAIYPSDTSRIKPTAVIDGKKAAQMMIIVGMKNTKSVPNAHTAENLAFGARLQQALHRQHNGLMRPMVLADARYNQQLCNGMILVEVGSDVNTLEEACYSGELLGTQLARVLKEM